MKSTWKEAHKKAYDLSVENKDNRYDVVKINNTFQARKWSAYSKFDVHASYREGVCYNTGK